MSLVNNHTYVVLFNFFSSVGLLGATGLFKQVITLLLTWCNWNIVLLLHRKCRHVKQSEHAATY